MRYMELENDGPETSFLAYTQEWIKKVDRGGLFVISDEAYRFFVTLELATRRKLPHHLLATATTTLTSSPPHEADVSAIVKSICDDDDVLFYWTFVGIDGGIDMDEDEDTNQELLQQIIHLWINIRGFSLSKAWMENYKIATTATTRKKKSLRKQLKL